MLARCYESIVAEGQRALLVLGDATNMAFDTSSFDVVVAASVFRVIRPPQAAADEILRVVRRPGHVVIISHGVAAGSTEDILGRRKRELLHAWGVRRTPERDEETLQAMRVLHEAGGAPSVFRTRGWTRQETPRSFIRRSEKGGSVAGQPWAARLTEELEREALSHYGSLDGEEEVTRHLEITVVRLP
jgi:SAM-dependent methyltransferase